MLAAVARSINVAQTGSVAARGVASELYAAILAGGVQHFLVTVGAAKLAGPSVCCYGFVMKPGVGHIWAHPFFRVAMMALIAIAVIAMHQLSMTEHSAAGSSSATSGRSAPPPPSDHDDHSHSVGAQALSTLGDLTCDGGACPSHDATLEACVLALILVVLRWICATPLLQALLMHAFFRRPLPDQPLPVLRPLTLVELSIRRT